MTFTVNTWWLLLCAAAVINVTAWLLSAVSLSRRQVDLCQEDYTVRRMQLLLSAAYVIGCAFRSVLPLYDIPRLCVVDSWLCNVAVGRSVATIAELCFVAQWAVLLRALSRSTGSELTKSISYLIVPMITVAETFSWYSVLTTSNIGHVVEETLWGVSGVLLVVGMVAMRSRCSGALRRVLDVCCITAVAYVAFMFLVDVPMYWTRWLADEAAGKSYLSLADGFANAIGRGNVSLRWDDWRHEVPWMTLYFSVAVWFSIALVHTPAWSKARNAR